MAHHEEHSFTMHLPKHSRETSNGAVNQKRRGCPLRPEQSFYAAEELKIGVTTTG